MILVMHKRLPSTCREYTVRVLFYTLVHMRSLFWEHGKNQKRVLYRDPCCTSVIIEILSRMVSLGGPEWEEMELN